MTEGPGLGGYPNLPPPKMRAPQAWKQMWQQGLVHGPMKAARAMQAVKAARAAIGKKRR